MNWDAWVISVHLTVFVIYALWGVWEARTPPHGVRPMYPSERRRRRL